MAILRFGASRLGLASSLESCSTLATRPHARSAQYSTDSTSQPSIHEVQALPRKRELRKVAEGSGSTAQLIGLAVKNTSERASRAPGQGQQQRSGQRTPGQDSRRAPSAAAGGNRTSRVAPGLHREELQRLLAERKAAAARGQTEGVYSSGPSGSGPRSGGPRRGPGGPGGRPRPPRAGGPAAAGAAGPGGPGATNNGAQRPRRPAAPRRPARNNAQAGPRESSRWSADELKPLVPPAHVSLSRANLAGLVKASALSETSQLRAALQQVGVSVDAKEKAERDQARKVLAGDYSLWLSDASPAAQVKGAKKDGKKSAEGKGSTPVEQARAVLSLNSTIPLKSRAQVLDKIREATV
ncbi:hypothetical protein JCM10908_005434 [Rhodotorula pacifica]|uniref:uncharacterized protein n=1 Tax=Rhodotorula pacifica TaxID=1495444 RepID=UPI00317BC7CE